MSTKDTGREIKFRVWDNRVSKMRPVFEIDFRADNSYQMVQMDSVTDPTLPTWGNTREHLVLMQFTGLKDKNGVNIYEGDIFQWGNDKGFVYFDSGCFIFRIGENYSMTMRDHYPEEIKIIGNIFENQNLLK